MRSFLFVFAISLASASHHDVERPGPELEPETDLPRQELKTHLPSAHQPRAAPAPGQGWATAPGQGWASAPGQGWAPAPGKGWAPSPGQGLAPAPGQGWAPAPGQGWAPAPGKGQGWAPAPGQGWAPAPGQGWAPASGQGLAPGPGQGWAPAPGKGWAPSLGQMGGSSWTAGSYGSAGVGSQWPSQTHQKYGQASLLSGYGGKYGGSGFGTGIAAGSHYQGQWPGMSGVGYPTWTTGNYAPQPAVGAGAYQGQMGTGYSWGAGSQQGVAGYSQGYGNTHGGMAGLSYGDSGMYAPKPAPAPAVGPAYQGTGSQLAAHPYGHYGLGSYGYTGGLVYLGRLPGKCNRCRCKSPCASRCKTCRK